MNNFNSYELVSQVSKKITIIDIKIHWMKWTRKNDDSSNILNSPIYYYSIIVNEISSRKLCQITNSSSNMLKAW